MSREKGPAPPPPARQDSSTTTTRSDDKENAIDVNKPTTVEDVAKQQQVQDEQQPKQEELAEVVKKRPSGGQQKATTKPVQQQPELKNNNQMVNKRQQISNNEEKRKSAPPKPESIEDYKKQQQQTFMKQNSLDEKNRRHEGKLIEERSRYDAPELLDKSTKSLENKRKTVEDKLNAVLEKRLSMDASKMITEALTRDSPVTTTNAQRDNNKSMKANSTENIKSKYDKQQQGGKSRSVGSSRIDSLEHFHEFDDATKKSDYHEDTVDRSVNNREQNVNVSVVTSTPIRNRSPAKNGSDVVVITGNNNYYILLN